MERLYEIIHPISLLNVREHYLKGSLELLLYGFCAFLVLAVVFLLRNRAAEQRGERRNRNLNVLQWGIAAIPGLPVLLFLFINPDGAWLASGFSYGMISVFWTALLFAAAIGALVIVLAFAIKRITKIRPRTKSYAVIWLMSVGFLGLINCASEASRILRWGVPWEKGDVDTLRFNVGGRIADDFDSADSVVILSEKPFNVSFTRENGFDIKNSDTVAAATLGDNKFPYYGYKGKPILPGTPRVFYSTLPQEVECTAWRNGIVQENFGVYWLGTAEIEPDPYRVWQTETLRVWSAAPFDFALGTKNGHSEGGEVTLWRHERDPDHDLQITTTSGTISQSVMVAGVRQQLYGFHQALALLGYFVGWIMWSVAMVSVAGTPFFSIKPDNTKKGTPEAEEEPPVEDIQVEIVQVEKRVSDLATRMNRAFAPSTRRQHSKDMKQSQRTQEDLSALGKELQAMKSVGEAALSVARSQNDLKRVEIERRKLEEIETLKADLEVARLHADIAEQQARKKEIENPPKPAPAPHRKTEQELRAEKEAEADRREAVVAEKQKEWRAQGMSEDDVAFRRERGWL
jgi:hypothetical protein